MPLFEMSPNILEPEAVGRKRSHDDFSGELIKPDLAPEAKTPGTFTTQPSGGSLLHVVTHNSRHPSPEGPLTEAGGSTSARKSPTPQNPSKKSTSNLQPAAASTSSTQPATAANPPVKRKRLSAEEKAKQEEEKAARVKEREERKKKKEEEDRVKAEKKQRVKEEKERKERSQKKLATFFTSTPKKTEGEAAAKDQSPVKARSATSTTKQENSEYKKLFKPFFVKENTRLASATTQMDEETRETRSRVLDEHMANQRHEVVPFNPMDIFVFPSKPPQRGRLHQPVKHIMETAYRETQNSGNTGGADAGKIFSEVRTHLSKVPMKVISFSQDVRPAYYGTITFKVFALGKGNMQRLARRSMGRRLPLDYDYDSEAEWQEEEGEDLDVEDEEEDVDDEDDMDGFLDDSEDVGVSRRLFGNTMEPDSTGVCFENQDRKAANPAVYEHKMEFIHEGLEHHWGIDPFSTQYWEPEPKAVKAVKATKATKAKISKPSTSPESEAKMPPPRAPANAFAAIGGGAGSGTGPAKLVKAELMNDVKRAILDNKALSKVGIVDFIFHQFRDSVSRAEVKNTVELVAEKKGAGRTKEWELKPGHEIGM